MGRRDRATLEGAGSWTVKDPSVERGAEADECYFVGVVEGRPTAPSLSTS